MKLGILGGTFNPIHNAHLQLADIATTALELDRVLLMVAADPPHKAVDGQISAARRLEMTRLAVNGLDRVEASELEIRRGGKSYMSDTLEQLHAQYPGAELYLIVGSDMLLDLRTWHAPETVMRLATIAAVPRQGQQASDAHSAAYLRDAFHAHIERLTGQADTLSSTEIRNRLFAALPVSGMLPADVDRYCYEEGLYFPPDIQRIQRQVREALPNKRYVHTMGVVRTAAELAARWGADPQ